MSLLDTERTLGPAGMPVDLPKADRLKGTTEGLVILKPLSMILIGALLSVALAGCGTSSSELVPTNSESAPTNSQSGSCAPSVGLNFVCGIEKPEDVVLVPNSDWLLASGMAPGSGLHLVNTSRNTVSNPYAAGTSKMDKTKYPGCPSPLDPAKASLAGLSVRPTPSGHDTVYAINRGDRQAVEVFDLDTSGAAPTAIWVGCVPIPDGLTGNSIAPFSDGTLLVTVPTKPGTTFDDVLARKITGASYMWTPGSAAFQAIPGSELSGNNGIETSPDDSKFYVVDVGNKRVVEFGRQNPGTALRFAQLEGFVPDNIHWSANNQLTVAGQMNADPSCKGTLAQCSPGYIVDTIDTTTMVVTKLTSGPATPDFPGTSTALKVGGKLWLSSFLANRLAYRSLDR